MEHKVHNIEDEIVITADHNSNGKVKYHVCYGKVDWSKSGENLKPAIFILMSYDGRINYQTPAHLTLNDVEETDFEKVLEALIYLKNKYLIEKKFKVNSYS